MLVLTRKCGQEIILGEDLATIKILGIDEYGGVRIGITAPKELSVHRSEVHHQILRSPDKGGREISRNDSKWLIKPRTDSKWFSKDRKSDVDGNR